MLTEKDYCNDKVRALLKEIGCPLVYETPFITLYEVQKWLREEREINISPIYLFTDWGCVIKTPKYGDLIESHSSYEEALLEGIKKAVKILKNNGKAN